MKTYIEINVKVEEIENDKLSLDLHSEGYATEDICCKILKKIAESMNLTAKDVEGVSYWMELDKQESEENE